MNDASKFVQAIRGPIMLITLGALVAIDYAGIYGFRRTWPVLIIVFGVLKLMERSAKAAAGDYPPPSSSPYRGDRPPGGNVI
jgi:hypothetical protein